MNAPEHSRGVIGLRTALVLYGVLVVASFTTLKGIALVVALVIVLGLAVKTYVHHLRRRIE